MLVSGRTMGAVSVAGRPAGATRRRQAVRAAAAVCLVALACGKKGDPAPPVRIIPAMTRNLAAAQRGDQLVLRFAYPATTTAGAKLPGLAGVEVWQLTRPLPSPPAATPPPAPTPAPTPPAEGAAPAAPPQPTPVPKPPLPTVEQPEFVAGAKQLATLSGAELQSAIAGDAVVIRLPLPPPTTPPTAHVFGIRTQAEGGETSAWSNLATLVPEAPPAAPAGLEVAAQARGVEITWQAPAAPAAGFVVYRRPAMARTYGEPLATLPAEARQHLDATARYGERYIYTVTSLASQQPRVESGFAAEREIDYQDRFAPAPPEGVDALPGAAGVELVWRPSADTDVVGYHVYRRDPQGDFRRLTEQPTAELKYSDSGLASGVTFTYRVTAVDNVGNEGPPSPDLEATTR